MFAIKTNNNNTNIRHRKKPVGIQAKLKVGMPGDRFEREADTMADRVMSMPDSMNRIKMNPVSGKPDINMKCEDCEKEKLQMKTMEDEDKIQMKPMEEEDKIQMKPMAVNGLANRGDASNKVSSDINSSKGSGRSLPEKVSNGMGSKMGFDFSGVKIHTDSGSIQMNRDLGSRAFTHGQDIYFNKGQFNPDNSKGKHLLAHELTHVIQQQNDIPAIQRMTPCPGSLNKSTPTPSGWKSYNGNSWFFHCGFRGILEDRVPTPDDPQNECFYDKTGSLVDKNHAFANCGGTPNQYDSNKNPILHTLIDSGGIVSKGWDAFWESRKHDVSGISDIYDMLEGAYDTASDAIDSIEGAVETGTDIYNGVNDFLDFLGGD